MIVHGAVIIPEETIGEISRRYHVRELALFGSALRPDFRDDSDIDILVEFEPGAPVGLLEFVGLKHELSDLLGREVDLIEKDGLKHFVRDRVLRSAQVIYATR